MMKVKSLDCKKLKVIFISLGISVILVSGFFVYKEASFRHRAQKYATKHNIVFQVTDMKNTINMARKSEKDGNNAKALTFYKQAEQFGYPDFEKDKSRIISNSKSK